MKKGTQERNLKMKRIAVLGNLNPIAGKDAKPYRKQLKTMTWTRVKNSPRTKQPLTYGAEMFLRAVSKEFNPLGLSCESSTKPSGMICERFRGKSLQVRFLANPTQNCPVPNEQVLGSIASRAVGIAVAIVPAALSTLLIAPGIAVATRSLEFRAPAPANWGKSKSVE